MRYASPLGLTRSGSASTKTRRCSNTRWARKLRIFSWSLGKDSRVHPLPAASQIAEKVQAVRNGVEQAGRRAFSTYTRAAHQLYDDLIAPALPALAGKRRLLISPDGPLHFLSFDVLLTKDAPGERVR